MVANPSDSAKEQSLPRRSLVLEHQLRPSPDDAELSYGSLCGNAERRQEQPSRRSTPT